MTGRSFQSYLNALMNPGDTRREVCAIPGCRRASAARGLCATHYKRTLAGKEKVEIGLALGAGPSDTVEASIASGYGPAWSEVSERDKERIITRVQEAIKKKQGTLEGFDPLLFATRCGVNASISAHRAAQSAPRILARQVAKEEVRSEEQRRVMALRKRFPQLSEEFVNLARKDTAEKPVKAVSFRSVWRELFCGIRNADELPDTVLKRRARMRENLQGRASNDLLGLLGWTIVDPDFRHLEDLRAKNDPERLPAEVQRLPDPPKVKPPRRELPERGFAVSLPKTGGRGRRPVDLTPWKHLFGQYSDSELALITGVAYATVRKYREMWGIPRTPGYLRKNPADKYRWGPPSGWARQKQVFIEMPTSHDPERADNYGSYYGRHLAQHYLLGAQKEISGGMVMHGMKRDMYPDWTPAEHLGLVAFGIEQIRYVRDSRKREFVIAEFLKDVTAVLGDESVSAHEIVEAMLQS